jgi:hypothetical protein
VRQLHLFSLPAGTTTIPSAPTTHTSANPLAIAMELLRILTVRGHPPICLRGADLPRNLNERIIAKGSFDDSEQSDRAESAPRTNSSPWVEIDFP